MRAMMLMGCLLAAAAPAAAQRPDSAMRHQGMRMGQGQGMGMMAGGILGQVMRFAPERILGMADHLNLTPDQTAKLASLRDAAKQAADDAHQPAMAAHRSLNRVLADTPDDTTAIRQYFLAHHTAEGNMQWIRASAAFQARALLTPQQGAMVEAMK